MEGLVQQDLLVLLVLLEQQVVKVNLVSPGSQVHKEQQDFPVLKVSRVRLVQ